MRVTVSSKDFSWDEVKKPFKYEFKLEPNKTFAFHNDLLDEYKGKVSKTTQAHFIAIPYPKAPTSCRIYILPTTKVNLLFLSLNIKKIN